MNREDDDEKDPLRQSMLRYIEGILPEEQVRELNARLKADAAARAEFGEVLIQCTQLEKIGRQERLQAVVPAERQAGLLWKAGAIAAGALIVIGLLALLMQPPRPVRPQATAPPAGPVEPERTSDATVNPEKRPGDPRPPQAPGVPEKDPGTPAVDVARVEDVRGEVFILTPAGRLPVAAGMALRAGQGLETAGAGSSAVLRYDDGSQLRAQGESRVSELSASGIRGVLESGRFEVEATRGSAKKSILFATPRGDVHVRSAGIYRVRVEPGNRGSTRLEVAQGEADLKRKADGKTARVPAGCVAEASADAAPVATWIGPGGLAAKRIALEGTVTINFGPEGTPLPKGVMEDLGEEFETERGYGWKGPKEGKELPGVFLTRPDGKRFPLRTGREPHLSERLVESLGPLRASYIVAGWKDHTETWVLPLPNGRYLVTICCGDPDQPRGPHHVSVEGVQVIDAVITRTGEFAGVKEMPIDVKDGELTLIVGGSGKAQPDGDSETALNYLIITRTSE